MVLTKRQLIVNAATICRIYSYQPGNPASDVDGDGDVDIVDFALYGGQLAGGNIKNDFLHTVTTMCYRHFYLGRFLPGLSLPERLNNADCLGCAGTTGPS